MGSQALAKWAKLLFCLCLNTERVPKGFLLVDILSRRSFVLSPGTRGHSQLLHNVKLGKGRVWTHSELCPLCGMWRNKFKQNCAPKDGGTSGGVRGESLQLIFTSCSFRLGFMNREESYKVSRLLAIHGFPLRIFLSESYEHFNHMDTIPTYAVREIVLWQSTLGTLREQTKPCVSTLKGKSDEQSYRATSERGNPLQRDTVCCSNTCHGQGERHGGRSGCEALLSALHIPPK